MLAILEPAFAGHKHGPFKTELRIEWLVGKDAAKALFESARLYYFVAPHHNVGWAGDWYLLPQKADQQLRLPHQGVRLNARLYQQIVSVISSLSCPAIPVKSRAVDHRCFLVRFQYPYLLL